MRSPNLQLFTRDDDVSVAPTPGSAVCRCTADESCQNLATHRLLARSPARVDFFCDVHTHEWASDRGIRITTHIANIPAA